MNLTLLSVRGFHEWMNDFPKIDFLSPIPFIFFRKIPKQIFQLPLKPKGIQFYFNFVYCSEKQNYPLAFFPPLLNLWIISWVILLNVPIHSPLKFRNEMIMTFTRICEL